MTIPSWTHPPQQSLWSIRVRTLSVCTWIHSYTTVNTPISAEPKLPSPHNAVTKQKGHLPLFFFLNSSLSQVITSWYNISTFFTYYRNSVFYWAAQNTLELDDRKQYYQDWLCSLCSWGAKLRAEYKSYKRELERPNSTPFDTDGKMPVSRRPTCSKHKAVEMPLVQAGRGQGAGEEAYCWNPIINRVPFGVGWCKISTQLQLSREMSLLGIRRMKGLRTTEII